MAVITVNFRNSCPTPPSALQRSWNALRETIVTHRTRRLLAAMDDRMLSDIGISRAQAGHEADLPIWDSGLR